MSGIEFNAMCPACKGKMAEGNKFCSAKCEAQDKQETEEEEIEENEPVRSWEN